MIRNTAQYLADFKTAWSTSMEWITLSPVEDREEQDLTDLETVAQILDPILNHYIEKIEHPIESIRTNCTGIHFSINHFLRQLRVPGLITIGDVCINGTPFFGTDYNILGKEILGHNDGGENFDAHVWLTMRQGKILDLTIGPYMLAKHLGGPGFPPPDFKWIEHIYRSDRNEPGPYQLTYKPMLFGHRVLSSVLPIPSELL